MKNNIIFYANIPTIIFLIFAGYCLANGHNGFAITSFIVSICLATTFNAK